MLELGLIVCMLLAVVSRTNNQLVLFYFLSGIMLSAILLSNGLVLVALVQGMSSTAGAVALLLFGGEIVET